MGSRNWQKWSSPAGSLLGIDIATRRKELCLLKDRNDVFGKSIYRLRTAFQRCVHIWYKGQLCFNLSRHYPLICVENHILLFLELSSMTFCCIISCQLYKWLLFLPSINAISNRSLGSSSQPSNRVNDVI